MSRCVVIPFEGKQPDLSPRQQLELDQYISTFAACLQKILQLSEDELALMADIVGEMKSAVITKLERYKELDEMVVERVAHSMGILYAFTLKV